MIHAVVSSAATRWNTAAVAVALATGLGVALIPLGQSTTVGSDGVEVTTDVSLLASEGAGVLAVLAVPALLVAVPLLFRRPRRAFASRAVIVGLLGVLVVLGALSIGVFFVPTLVAMAASLAASTLDGQHRSSIPR
jgi:hypothetical protein